VLEDLYPVRWVGRQAVVALPEHIGVSNAGLVLDELLSVINRGATSLIADLTATVSCDYAGADAVARAYQRAVSSGTELLLAVTAPVVLRALSLSGLHRLVSVYPSLQAALAARPPAAAAALPAAFPEPAPGRNATAGTPPRAAGRLDALQDGMAAADSDGTIAAASERLEDMFGYGHGELPGRTVESLVPDSLRTAHRGHHAAWIRSPGTRPTGAGAPLAGLRKDGTTFPAQVSLIPVTVTAGLFTLAVIRDLTPARHHDGPARDTATAEQQHAELLDAVITGIFHAGLSLQAAASLPAETARQRIEAALGDLDDIIRDIRRTAFAPRGLPRPAPPGDDR
jgi:PAS domain S-box-containing protein